MQPSSIEIVNGNGMDRLVNVFGACRAVVSLTFFSHDDEIVGRYSSTDPLAGARGAPNSHHAARYYCAMISFESEGTCLEINCDRLHPMSLACSLSTSMKASGFR